MQHLPVDQEVFSVEARTRILNGSRVSLPARQQLLDRLLEETGGSQGAQRLTVCVAPTGYGKTRTIVHWLGDGSNERDRVRWVRCVPGSTATLWHTLSRELAAFSGLNQQPSEDPLTDTTRFAEALTHSTTIVLDDYHHATTPENDVALANLASSSKHLMLVVIGRSVGLLNTTLITARTRVRLIDTQDLALPLDEAHELALSLGIPLDQQLEAAFEQTDGWPLAIRAALNLGSDALYLTAPASDWNTASPHDAPAFNPMMNLNTFAVNYVKITSTHARRVILATAQLDAITIDQISESLDLDANEAKAAVQELLELGLLTAIPAFDCTEYRCHRAVKAPLEVHAASAILPEERKKLFTDRADRIASSAPLTAFRLYCAAENYTSAEIVLAHNFTTLTDEVELCGQVLRSIPESEQRPHPTFTAALLFLDTPRPSVTPSALAHITNLWLQSLQQLLPEQSPVESDPLYLPLLCQAMVATRVTGQIEASVELMKSLEVRLGLYSDAADSLDQQEMRPPNAEPPLGGSLPTYYREGAATALSAGDFAQARRFLDRLRRHSENRISARWIGFARASTRTVTETQAGNRWLLAALSELAFTELIDGDMRRCAELVSEMDTVAASTGESGPGISWIGAELARAHLSYEWLDPAYLEYAAAKLAPLSDRLEPWPLLLMAEAASMRNERGAEWALVHLRASASNANFPAQLQAQNKWVKSLTEFQAMLSTTSGDLSQAERLLSLCPKEAPGTRLERARLSLFSGDDVDALLIVQGIGDSELTKRQRTDRCIIGAVAAWGCGRQKDAFTALTHASEYLAAYELPSMLQSVPHDALREVAIAAKQAGICDLTALVEAVPEPARCHRYERLTEMETKTLKAISEHRNTGQAAAALFVTAGTVKKHLASVYRKLKVSGREEAILQAGRMGLLTEAAQ